MNETGRGDLRKVLGFAAAVEIGTGLALVLDPAPVVALLLGADATGLGVVLGRFLGIALLALGVACWPGGQRVVLGARTLDGMLTYNALVAVFLAYVGTGGHLAGLLLWPAVALHAAVALLLVWTWRTG